MSNNRGPWATSAAQAATSSDHAAMAVQVGTLPAPPAEVLPASTLAQALAWLIEMVGNVDNADRLDGQHGDYYTNAGNLSAGTVPLTRLAAALAQIGALTPTTGGVPYHTAPGGPANLFTTSAWFRGSWAPLADSAAARVTLGMAGGALLPGCNADMVDGYHVGSAQTNTSGPFIPYIGADGMLEAGRFIDFHRTLGSGDSDVRLEISLTSGDVNMYISGNRIWHNGNIPQSINKISGITPTTGAVMFFPDSSSNANLFTTSAWFRGTWAPLADKLAAQTALDLKQVATTGSASDITSGTLNNARLSIPLAAIGALAPAADKIPYYTGGSSADLATLGAWVRANLLPATSQSGARSALGLAAVSWTGAYADLSGVPTSLPASDVYSWAKQPTKPTYSFSEIAGTASASQITAVNTAGQHDNDTSPASTEYVLMHSATFRGVVQTNSDENIAVNFQTHGGNLLKAVSKGVFFGMPLGGGTGDGQYRPGDAVVISADRDFTFIIDFSAAGGSVQASGGTLLKSIIAPGGNGVFYYFVANENASWKMMHGAKSMAQTIDFQGGVAGEEQSPYYAFKLPDLHSSSHSTRIELSGAGCRSTASGYFGRSGAHIDATITASYRPGDCIEFVVGSNSTGGTGSSTLALLPLSGYTITAPGGGSGNAVAPTYSSGLAPFLAAVSTRPTSTASNAALDAGSQGGPMGGPGQKPNLRNGFGGGGAVFDGAGSGQYGAGAGVARLHYSSPYSRPKVIFALGCNAANGSAVFKDFGPSAVAVTASGGVTHSTAQKYAGINSIWLNGGHLSIGTPSIANFTAYSHVHIAMQWRYTGATGILVLFDTRTTSGGAGGFCLYFDTTNGIMGVYERERVIASAPVTPSSLINKFNLIEVEIVPGVARAFFRFWLNKSIVCYGFSEEVAAIESTDSFLIGKDVSIGTTLNDYIIGPCIMARL